MPIDPDKKTVYHSALVAAGPMEITITSDVLASKFQGKPNYVSFNHAGKSHQLNLENARCEAALRGRTGQTVTIEASGTREEADIAVYAPSGQATQPAAAQQPPRQAPAPQQAAAPPAQRAAAPPQRQEAAPAQAELPTAATPDDPVREAKQTIMQIANLYLECSLCVQKYVAPSYKRLTGEEMSEAKQQAAASSIFIKADKLGLQTRMSHKPM